MEKPQISYVPAAHEQQYYEGLYQMADTSRTGNIGGAEAVAFFSRSRLQVDTLKNIWTLADQPPTNSLDRQKFATAIRLIQLSQNGLKAQGSSLGGPPGMRPAMFDGVSGVTVQLPPPEPAGGGGSVGGPHGQAPSQGQAPQQGQNPPQQIPQAPSMQYSEQQSLASAPPSRTGSFSVPPSPGGNLAQGPPVMTNALVTQDPYSLAPQELSRYNDLFPNYAKEDGYIYGKEAVELFSKSGVPIDQLKQIWNMVDFPVDNRLDRLEFGLAMHLIVCVSKKGLPLPASLPLSLKGLKSTDAQTTELGGEPQAINSGAPPLAGHSTPLEPSNGAAPSMNGTMGGAQEPQLSVPPPLPDLRPTGLAISDAFEGLSSDTAAQGYAPPEVPSMPPPEQETITFSSNQMSSHSMEERAIEPPSETVPQPSPELSAPQPIPTAAPKTTEQLASSYNMGDDLSELSKLKATMQKLQAENIALKAQMGNMTEEEREVKRETMATIDEITRLSTELTELRAQVLATKSRLLESTAELTAGREKKSALSDLIAETRATNDVLQQAENDIQNMNLQAQEAPVPIPPPVAEADLFGGWDQPAPPSNVPAPAPTTNVQATNAQAQFTVQAPLPEPIEESPAPWGAPNAVAPLVQAPAPMAAHPPAPMASHPPAPAPPIVETASYESEENYSGFGAAPLCSDSSSLPANNSAQTVPTQHFQQQMNFAPNNMDGGMIGGVPAPPVENNTFGNGPPPVQSSLSTDDIEDMKDSARRAEQTSQEAEETYRALSSEVEQLRNIADQADAIAKEKAEKASKKKGLGKKKASKEAEQAAQEAAEKKKHFLEMQAKASNAQALAMESKRETERLRDQAEQAELDFVSSESTKYAQPNQNPPQPSQDTQGYGQPMMNAPVAHHHQENVNPGLMSSDPSDYGGMPDPSQISSYPNYGGGYDQTQAAPASYGNGTHNRVDSCDFGFGDGIMGGGGAGIPTPQNNSAYVSPF
mmetsp:Transcript_25196/g.38075  ORF Transcript_25196/g.38075 Transcript_25196/m.38075 type:complete len:985 (-) Transcript_25196:86-3040(-)